MNNTIDSGLEVTIPNFPEVTPQLYGNKYYTGGGAMASLVLHPNQSNNQTQAKLQHRSRLKWSLAVITVFFLTVAIGAGLGAGLTAKSKSSPAM